MSREQLQRAGDLIRAKRFAEARAILKTIDHPTAREWLKKLDSLAPEPPPNPPAQRNLLASGAVIVLLLVVVGAGIAYIRVQPGGAALPAPDQTGCGAQTWWNRVNDMFAVMSFNSLLSESSSPNYSAEIAAIRSQREAFNSIPYPDCVAPARDELLAGTAQLIDGLEKFDLADTSVSMQPIYAALLAYQQGALKLAALGVTFDPHVDQNLAALTSDCPALLWIIENLFVKNHFFEVIQQADSVLYDPDPASALQSFVFDLSGEQLALEYTTAPPCLQTAKTHMSAAMEAFIETFQAYSGQDFDGMLLHLDTLETELRAFGTEVEALGVPVDLGLEEG